jgi:hypothetical protein
MAASRIVLNEHLGAVNAALPGTLWWEHNTLLHWKPISGRWQAKKAAPWKPTLTMSCTAHIIDRFQIHCGSQGFETWTTSCIFSEFEAVADRVCEKLFTTLSYDEAEENILHVWMVMMRAPKTMPKYVDAIFETLGQLKTYNPSRDYHFS